MTEIGKFSVMQEVAVVEAVQVAFSGLVTECVEEKRAYGVDLLSKRNGGVELIIENALEGKCREACARAIAYLWLRHESVFNQLYLVQAVDDNRVQGVLCDKESQENLNSVSG